MKTRINHVNLVTGHGIAEDAAVLMADGKIQAAGRLGVAYADRQVDGEGLYLSAGFIDIHLHGGGGHDFMDGTLEAFQGALAAHLAHGTTACFPTTLTAGDKELESVFAAARQAKASTKAKGLPEILGLHLEGPFVAPEMAGAQDPKYIRTPDDGSWAKIAEMAGEEKLIWTVAPELPGAEEMCRALKGRGVIFSAGHSAAKYPDVARAIEAGYTMATHLYSGMSTIVREKGYRIPGLLEGAMLHDELCAEVIADSKHLPPELLRLIYKTKGKGRIVLVTDAMRGAGMPDGEYLLGSLEKGQLVSVFDGIAHMPDGVSFAGSAATADRLIRVMVKEAGVPLHEAVAMMTENPARETGLLARKGRVAPGYDADLVLFDQDIRVRSVWIGGEQAVGNG